ncbi:hypothetical protein EV382_3885 [Micromonospora violae]|uniref:PH (Pleckstrin Homology) domain-containing protein n=1 Tax=Micromonospora violae TaxID=1278207 RepID=A0A4Q7ULS9_9ACTN|nr:hypothetical protein [Micromonospora violae]RZT80629.1 hypothetical protein EV382_3885 [Micromonospora violae]
MIEKLSAATVRHRHVVLTLGLLLVGVNTAAPPSASAVGQRLLFLLSLTALVLAAVVMGVRPASFVVQPQIPAFATPGPAWTVFFALGYLGPASAHIGALLRATRQGTLSTFDVVLGVLWVVLAALMVTWAWRGHGVRLEPFGVRQTWALGSLTVPWAALLAPQVPSAADRRRSLPMRITEPHLVRRRGIPRGRGALRTDIVDAGFLAAAIGYYVAHPEHRAAIGGQAEYDRLRAALSGGEAALPGRE